ncbi:MAG: AraC family transcriptional regulator [Myxococcales bacterium]|nr:AraC family transcriptional regulator [Myxococcales bacterium]
MTGPKLLENDPTSSYVPSVSVKLYRPIALALSSHGIDASQFFSEFGISSPLTMGWDKRVHLEEIAVIWDRLLEVTGDPEFFLHAAAKVDIACFDVITYLESTVSTLRNALHFRFGYFRLLVDALEWTLEEKGGEALLRLHERPGQPLLPPVAEYMLGVWHMFLRLFGPKSWSLKQVCFRHSKPSRALVHSQLFGVNPVFQAANDGLIFSANWLDAPMRAKDEILADLLGHYAEQTLPANTLPCNWSKRVHQQLRRGCPPSLSRVAQALRTSPRSLQRSLAAEGTSYSEVVNQYQRQLAEELLRRRELGISEIASALNFTDGSTFHRAFKRWTGKSPSEFRAEISWP